MVQNRKALTVLDAYFHSAKKNNDGMSLEQSFQKYLQKQSIPFHRTSFKKKEIKKIIITFHIPTDMHCACVSALTRSFRILRALQKKPNICFQYLSISLQALTQIYRSPKSVCTVSKRKKQI